MLAALALAAATFGPIIVPARIVDGAWIVSAEVGGRTAEFTVLAGNTSVNGSFVQFEKTRPKMDGVSLEEVSLPTEFRDGYHTEGTKGNLGADVFGDRSVGFQTSPPAVLVFPPRSGADAERWVDGTEIGSSYQRKRWPTFPLRVNGVTLRIHPDVSNAYLRLTPHSAGDGGYREFHKSGEIGYGVVGPGHLGRTPFGVLLAVQDGPDPDLLGWQDGAMGMAALQATRFAFDLSNGRVWAAIPPRVELRRYLALLPGVELDLEGDQAILRKVDHEAADASGIIGLPLLSVDGRDYADIAGSLNAGGEEAWRETMRLLDAFPRGFDLIFGNDERNAHRLHVRIGT